MIAEILETLDFADPVRLNTKIGLRMVRKSPLGLDFWGAWNAASDAEKSAMKKAGFSLGKYREVWEMSWWSDDKLRFRQPDLAGVPAPEPEPEPVIDLPELQFPEKLFPYQVDSVRRGVATMSKYGRVLLGHGTGMGKTAIALAIARERGRRVAVICPKSITTDWHRLAKYLGVDVYEAVGWEWVKTGKSKIGNWTDKDKKRFLYTIPEDCDLVIDEAHKAKAPGATQNSLLLRDAVDQRLPCIALSATIASDPTQLWAMGMFLGLHSGGSDYYRFLARNGCYKTQWGMQFRGGKGVLKKLHSQIFPERGNRLRPIDAGDAFPETLIQARAFDMDSAKDIANEYDELSARIEELRMSENFMADKLAAITKARQRIELLKAPSIASVAKDLIEEGNSVFIAVNFTETREFLMKELKTKCAIYGGQKDMDRRGAIDSFQRDDSRVLIGIIQACREGISLHDTKGEYPRVALISPTYSALDLIQVLGRVHRAGGKSKSIQYIAYCSGVAVEETICKKLNQKMANLSSIMDGDLDTAVYLDTEKV
jgi:superfamily II DNA or RNA helicase